MATLNPSNIPPIAGTIRERMAGYALAPDSAPASIRAGEGLAGG